MSPQITLIIKALQIRHPKRNPFFGTFRVFYFCLPLKSLRHGDFLEEFHSYRIRRSVRNERNETALLFRQRNDIIRAGNICQSSLPKSIHPFRTKQPAGTFIERCILPADGVFPLLSDTRQSQTHHSMISASASTSASISSSVVSHEVTNRTSSAASFHT